MKAKLLSEKGFFKAYKEYLIMGIFINWESIYYLINDEKTIRIFPYNLFEITDSTIPWIWFCKIYTDKEPAYAHRRAIWGYNEFCFDEYQFEKLINDDEAALSTYFQRKLETEKCLNECSVLSSHDTQEQSQKKYSVTISENQTIDFQRRSHIAEIWDQDRIIATVAQNYTCNTFDVEMYPPLHGPLLLDYSAFEQAMQRARIQLIMAR